MIINVLTLFICAEQIELETLVMILIQSKME